MAKYYADCEFESSTGNLLSLGMVCPISNRNVKSKALYIVDAVNMDAVVEPWVNEHVTPHIFHAASSMLPTHDWDVYSSYERDLDPENRKRNMSKVLEIFLGTDEDITIVVDWPEDVKYISDLILTGPGTMIKIPSFKFEIKRVDSYPNEIPGCIQHHALWDAIALAAKLNGISDLNKSSELGSLLKLILKFTKADIIDTSYDALRDELSKTYHQNMTFGDVISLLCNAYDDLIKEPRFEQNLRRHKSQIEEIIKAPVDWCNRPVMNNRQLTLESKMAVIEFYQPIISTILSKFRLARVDWCKDQLE